MQVANSAITRLVSWQCLGVYMHRPFNQNSCGTLATVMKSLYICLPQWPSYLFSECLMSSLKMDIYHLFRVVVASTVLLLFLQVFTWNTNAMQGINSLWKVFFFKEEKHTTCCNLFQWCQTHSHQGPETYIQFRVDKVSHSFLMYNWVHIKLLLNSIQFS